MENSKTKQTTGAIILALATGISLASIKFVAGILTHSMAILASALDSLMDATVSTVNLIAALEAARPPDDSHEYGHEKIESLAGLFQSLFIGFSGLYIIYESIQRLIKGSYVQAVPLGIGVMVIAIVASALLVWRLQQVARQNKSLILKTESLHFSTDILSNLGVIVALVLVRFTGQIYWDLIVSILVGFYVISASAKILRNSIDELLDRSLPEPAKEEITRRILAFHPSIVGLHNFRSRQVGHRIFLDFHIEIRGEEDFRKAHLMTESLINNIRELYPDADVTVHYDPEGEA